VTSAIRLDHLSKRFTLRTEGSRSFQDTFLGLLRGRRASKQEFWALRDVSFEVQAGETLGLIGPNGSGKSTILKLISRILVPTTGHITTNGKVSTLLEIGAGFHPDLTGRENIYLNGSVMGLSRREINERLDDIIAFAELARFIDMPVKHYSSGMYMRLGFAVAIHVDPDILLVDEVLAVGDAAFQRKCLEQIDRMRHRGVTILFVSHDLETVRRLCPRAIWMDQGQVAADGASEAVVQRYQMWSWRQEEVVQRQVGRGGERRWGTGEIEIVQVRLLNGKGEEETLFRTGEPLVVEMHYRAQRRVEQPVFGLAIHRSDGVHVAGPSTRFSRYEIPWVEGEGRVRYRVEQLPLLEGLYYLSVATVNQEDTEMYDYHDRLYPFSVVRGKVVECYGVMTLNGSWDA
jgi:ABC-type polysaccharide/polyol phosphate transport system ATPase subunit